MTFKRLVVLSIPTILWLNLFYHLAQSQFTRDEVAQSRIEALGARVNSLEVQNIPQRLAVLENKVDSNQKSLDKIEGWAQSLVFAILYLVGESLWKVFNYAKQFRSSTRRSEKESSY